MSEFTVFIADDDDDDFHFIKEAFRHLALKYMLIHLKDGARLMDALAICEKCGNSFPDLILLDINMPKVDGIRALEMMKGNEAFRKIPVVVYSTSDCLEQKDKCINLGAKAVVTKDTNFEKVLAFVKSIDRLLRDPKSSPGPDDTDPVKSIKTCLL